MQKHAGIPMEQKFTEPQTAWLQLIRDHVITSFRFEHEDLEYAAFDAQGGLGKMHQLFGDQMDTTVFSHLREHWIDLFNTEFDILLYDLTSSYFEVDANGEL